MSAQEEEQNFRDARSSINIFAKLLDIPTTVLNMALFVMVIKSILGDIMQRGCVIFEPCALHLSYIRHFLTARTSREMPCIKGQREKPCIKGQKEMLCIKGQREMPCIKGQRERPCDKVQREMHCIKGPRRSMSPRNCCLFNFKIFLYKSFYFKTG